MNIVLFSQEEIGSPLKIDDKRAKHIIEILKFKEDDIFFAGVINKGTGKAKIDKINKNFLYFTFEYDGKPIEKNRISLLTAITRPIEAKKILKNCTTIGVSAFYLSIFDKSEKSYFESSLWKNSNYKEYLIEGSCQACACDIPDVFLFSSLDESLKNLPENSIRAALDNYEAEKSLAALEYTEKIASADGSCCKKSPPLPEIILAVAGERGFSNRERVLLKNHGFKLYSLGKRVLKTETAAIAGLAVILSNNKLS
ncbi:MAG: 16S rRNA (uracil(1498)-N(3))-methyltransferase [Spirochaetaceae bacterium]|nr:16S rRNA (uracil(1498)-N(3))-methyltransferase [Spirochaetaceae bacterium]